MLEKQLFEPFVPKNAHYLLLGSFTVVASNNTSYDWYYCGNRNQFWRIIEKVYNVKLDNTVQKKRFSMKLKLAFADTILTCERRDGNSLDTNLINRTYNIHKIGKIIKNNPIQEIFFSSRFVENIYRMHFKDIINVYPDITLTTLPSPSPRYARMSFQEKAEHYQKLLPEL